MPKALFRRSIHATVLTLGIAMSGLPLSSQAAQSASTVPDTLNIRVVGHTDLNGAGKGGEGLALKEYGQRKVLFLAHESGPQCFSVIDVTTPSKPVVLKQIQVEAEFVRCNSLGLSGDVLVVARQTLTVGQPHGGITTYDVSDAANPKLLAYMDLTGPNSRGTHYLTFSDGRYAYLATGAKDFVPKNPLDDQMMMIVDLQDPKAPREVSRWWLPGTRVGDESPAPARVKRFDNGFRLHTLLVPPERPDRAYAGWIDGGFIVFDISDKTKPREISRVSWQSLNEGFLHTALPILSRGLLVASQESTKDECADWPQRITVVDIKDETHPYPLSTLPRPANFDTLCKQGGRFGAHNINLNNMPAVSRMLQNTVVTAQFGGGLRIYSIEDPLAPKEIAYFAPKVAGNKGGVMQMNDLIVGKDGLIYANDRLTGGLYILQYTGKTPLN
jgi:hypothetical protein